MNKILRSSHATKAVRRLYNKGPICNQYFLMFPFHAAMTLFWNNLAEQAKY